MTQPYLAVNSLMDLVRNNTTLNLNAREVTPFYQEGRVDFNTECRWKNRKINQLKEQVRSQLNLDVTVTSKLRSNDGFPTRRVQIRIRYYPNVVVTRQIQQITLDEFIHLQLTLGPDDEDQLGW